MLAVAAAFLPEILPALLGGTSAAWMYVMSGAEAWALWVVVAALASFAKLPEHAMTTIRCVCSWGAFEAMQRPVCRLAYPMNTPPPMPPSGQNLCDVVTGLPMSWVSVVAALFLAAIIQEVEKDGRTR